jgi:hypothetical protein
MIGGVTAMWLVTPSGAVIATMLAVVVFRTGRRSMPIRTAAARRIVAKDNLGTMPALIAAARC